MYRIISITFLSLIISFAVFSQDRTYNVFIDKDNSPSTGCNVSQPEFSTNFNGIEGYISISTTNSTNTINSANYFKCNNGVFSSQSSVDAALGLNTAENGYDVFEAEIFTSELEINTTTQSRLYFSAESLISTDIVTNNNGAPITVGVAFPIPSLSLIAIIILTLIFLIIAKRTFKNKILLTSIVLIYSSIVWAMITFVIDGEVDDWSGFSAKANDPIGDNSAPGNFSDISSVFAFLDQEKFVFRMDIVDVENEAPIVNDVSTSVLEDGSVVITLIGSDINSDILNFNVNNPSQGSLTNLTPINANSASITYTPNPDYFGKDTFTYTSNDGQATSPQASVMITVLSVNDQPSFVAPISININENFGPYNQAWATSIDLGADNESSQSVVFNILSNDNSALFSILPSIDAVTGNISFTPQSDMNGSANLVIEMQDDGGSQNGGFDTSTQVSLSINIAQVNAAPSFTIGSDQSILEDAGVQTIAGWATNISAGPSDESGQVLTFNIVNISDSSLFSVTPSIDPNTGDLSFIPAADANGFAEITINLSDNGGTANGGQDTSASQTFMIEVTAVNDAPDFTNIGDVSIQEDSGSYSEIWASAISVGPVDEVSQTVNFNIISNDNTALFSILPSIDAGTGILSFTPNAGVNGTANLIIELQDDGGVQNGGIDTSTQASFAINISQVNDAPSFIIGNNEMILEDAGAQTVTGWATAISAGDTDESGQVLTFNIINNSNSSLFSVAPSIDPNTGDLSYIPAADVFGTAMITINLSDDGGTTNGGEDTSPNQVFQIDVTPINDAPSFTNGGNVTIDEDFGPYSASWATVFSSGPINESVQNTSFNITSNDNPALFDIPPSVDSNGILTFTPLANVNGVATITLNIMDDGGTSNGGINISADQSFTINIDSINDAPVNTVPGSQSVDEDNILVFSGPTLISVNDLDIGMSQLNVMASVTNGTIDVTSSGSALVNNNGSDLVEIIGTLIDVNDTLSSLFYNPNLNFNGNDTLTILSDDGGATGAGGALNDSSIILITVNPINDAPVNSVPSAQTLSSGMLEFSTANSNTISVLDIDADTNNIQVDISVTDGTLDAVVTPGVVISNNTSAAVTLTGQQADINTALDGLLYLPNGFGTDTLTLFTNDLGNTGLPGALSDSDTVDIMIDAAPFVSSTIPAQNGTIASNGIARVNISEQVNLAAGGIELNCMPSGSNFAQGAVSNDNTFGYVGFGQPGDDCTITITSTAMTDVDAIDPPDELDGNNDNDGIDGDIDDFVLNYSIDAAPTFVSSSPTTGSTVANNAVFTATFSEPVDLGMGALSLNCGGPIAITPSGSGTNTLTFTPDAPLPDGSSCIATLVAANITDSDNFDPPDNLPADIMVSFNVDAAPTVLSNSPVNMATQVATNTNVVFNFSENVDFVGSAITLNCSGNITGSITGSGSNTLTFNPSSDLPANTLCTASAIAANISDSDAFDPPNNLASNLTFSFTTDAPPSVVSTLPANGALLQSPTGATITVDFSEPVNFDTTANAANTSFDLECPTATSADFTVMTASPANSVIIDPNEVDIAGETCVLTIRGNGISDVDASDPPDNMTSDIMASIEYIFPAVAVNDTYSITPHLFHSIDTGVQSGRVTSNDTLGGSGAITGFGPVGSCSTATPNGTNFITTSNGGRVILSLNGSFSYAPPAGLVGNGVATSPEDAFCYTVTGGDTANVDFEFDLTELVWFADAAYAGANGPADGTQARPHVNLPDITAVDTTNDTIHLLASATPYTGATLEVGTRLIGAGSASDLGTITGITPVTGSAFPALGGTRPTITGSGISLAMNNLIRGLNIGNTLNSGLFSPAPFGVLTMSEASIIGNGRAINFFGSGTVAMTLDEITASGAFNGIIMGGVGGSITVGAGGTNIGSTTGGDAIFIQNAPAATNFNFGATTINTATNGINTNGNNGSSQITFTSLAITAPTGTGLFAQSGIINIGGTTNTINAAGGPALNLTNTNTGSGWIFNSLSSINSSSNGIIVNGISGGGITGNGGSISGSTGTAFQALNGLGGGFSYTGVISKSSTGRLIDISGLGSGNVTLSGNLNCNASCSNGAGNEAIRITERTGGTVAMSGQKIFRPEPAANPQVVVTNNSGATINFSGVTAAGSNAFPVQDTAYEFSGGGTINLNGQLDAVTNSGRAIVINGVTVAGSITTGSFTTNGALGTGVGAIEIVNSATPSGLTLGQTLFLDHDDGGESGGGIRLQNNTGIYSFPSIGSINSIDTPALSASNAGTISLGSTTPGPLDNNGGIAIDVQNTTVGAAGITATRVQSGGGTNGIILNNTGTNPALSVLGTGSPGSGGTISNKTGDGIRLQNTQGVSLNFVNFTNTASTNGPGPCSNNIIGNTGCNAAIDMQTVSGITLNGLSISGGQQYGINGNTVSNFSMTGTSISNSGNQLEEDGVRFINLTGTNLIRNSTIQDSHTNNLRIYNTVATPLILDIGETISGTSRLLRALNNDGVLIEGVGNANMSVVVENTDFDSSDGDHIQTAISDNAIMDIIIANNTMTATNPLVFGSGITLSSSANFNGNKTYLITGNSINGANAKAINVNLGTNTGVNGTYTGSIVNNLIGTSGISESGGAGIDVLGNGNGTLNATIANNTVRQFDSDHGIRVLHRDGAGRINASVSGNTVTQPEFGGFNGILVQSGSSSALPDSGTVCVDITGNSMAGSGAVGGSATDFRLRQRFSTTFLLRGYTGVSTDTAAVVSYVQGANSAPGTGSATTELPGSGFINSPGGNPCF